LSNSNFVDYVKIYFRSGKGGAGAVAWRREKFVALGGPSGGNGGRGGDIIIKGDPQLWTLLDLKYRKFIHAKDGEGGSGSNRYGKDAEDIILNVPLGTVARDADTDEVLAEITDNGQEAIILKGGIGGMGNAYFKSATVQSPDFAQPGMPGEERAVILELKVLADVGLVGFPNAGKSTLLSVLSAARPEIADYPFTTIKPNLGIVRYHDYRSFVMADIPGIIEGAHLGKGLGTTFLRHIERNAVLLFMVPADSNDIQKEFEILLNELEQFDPILLEKSRILAISKSDLLDDELKNEILASLPATLPVIFISSITGSNMEKLKDLIWEKLNNKKDFISHH